MFNEQDCYNLMLGVLEDVEDADKILGDMLEEVGDLAGAAWARQTKRREGGRVDFVLGTLPLKYTVLLGCDFAVEGFQAASIRQRDWYCHLVAAIREEVSKESSPRELRRTIRIENHWKPLERERVLLDWDLQLRLLTYAAEEYLGSIRLRNRGEISNSEVSEMSARRQLREFAKRLRSHCNLLTRSATQRQVERTAGVLRQLIETGEFPPLDAVPSEPQTTNREHETE